MKHALKKHSLTIILSQIVCVLLLSTLFIHSAYAEIRLSNNGRTKTGIILTPEVKDAQYSSRVSKANPLVATKICEVSKPVNFLGEKRARLQAALPTSETWKENPFVENAPEPSFEADESRRGYMLFRRPITHIVYPNSRPRLHERLRKLNGFGCRGEFEPLTFSIYPKRKLKNFKVRVSELRKDKDVIPTTSISVKLQTYWKIPYSHYITKRDFAWRWMPELLEPVTVHTSASKVCQRYWLTVKVPKNAPSGVYHGQVTIWDDGYGKAVQIPISFRVMSFDLKKDPNKHYTAYSHVYPRSHDHSGQKIKNTEWIMKAVENNYRSMVEHGFDVIPTLRISYDSKKNKLLVRRIDQIIAASRKAGFKNIPFVPVAAGTAIGQIIKKYDKTFKWQPHWRISDENIPPEHVFTKITELFQKLQEEWTAKGYPKIYCCPLDEVDSSAWKFGQKVYTAVKRSGIGIYITKNPLATDARYYKDVIDAFCSQSFALPYEQVAASKRLQYWCYPNHNSWEVRNPSVQCNGGRMTYGFGFWRSGYTVLIPWTWARWNRWIYNKAPSYMSKVKISHGKRTYYTSGGNATDEKGQVINATYWECFREGYDDGRYIYTLQQAIAEREHNLHPKCRKLVKKGQSLLQDIWDRIQVKSKYIEPATVSILPDEFDALRWRIATITEELVKFKGKSAVVAPSVLIKASATKKIESTLEREAKRDNLIVKRLDNWKSLSNEGKLTVVDNRSFTGKKCLQYHIKVDHNVDGGGEKGSYPIGWPRMIAKFKAEEIDLTQYEFLSFYVLINSNRDEVADDNTPAFWTFSSHVKGARLPTQSLLGRVPQQVWIPIMLPLNSIIDHNADLSPWKSIRSMQFGIREKQYKHGTELTFLFDDISLVSFKTPLIENVLVPSTLILPRKDLYCKLKLLGTAFVKPGKYRIVLELLDRKGKKLAKAQSELYDCKSMTLKLPPIQKGTYILKGVIQNTDGQTVSHWQKTLSVIAGPTTNKKTPH